MNTTLSRQRDNPASAADPPFLIVALLAARRAGDRPREAAARERLAEVGIRIAFGDELDAPTRRKGVSR